MAATMIMEHNVPAAMRDGVRLMANVYRPAADGRYPVLLTRLPYGKDVFSADGLLDPARAVRAGYVVIVQDCRGRFASEGTFRAFEDEAQDGYDTVEWAAALPYSDGNVGMFGGSYFGYTQWAAASQRPPHLKAIAPMITWSDRPGGSNFRGGASELGLGLHWYLLMALDQLPRFLRGQDPAFIRAKARELADFIDRLSTDGYRELPLTDLPGLRGLGLSGMFARTITQNPARSGRGAAPRVEEAAVPSLNVGGWYDVFQQGTIDNFVQAREAGQTAHLMIGPWTHLNRGSAVQDVDFGLAAQAAMLDLATDLTAIHLRWFDRWLKGLANGVDIQPPVHIFVMGENRWRYEQEWPLARTVYTPWYLQGSTGAGGPEGPTGGLTPVEPEASGETPSAFVYDPHDPVPSLGGNVLMPGVYGSGARDQRPLEARPDVLSFTSEPLTEPLEVIGPVTVHLWASTDAPDTDFVARLVDVRPDGFAQNLADGIIRARYRKSLAEPHLLQPGEVFEYTIDLWSVANRFLPGHRVRLDITSSSFPRWDRNPNTGEVPGTTTEMKPARQTIYHDAAHPSRVILPVIPPTE